MSILHSIGAFLSGIALAIGSVFTPAAPTTTVWATPDQVYSVQMDVAHLQDTVDKLIAKGDALGASLAIPSVVALFETTLASAISSAATSMTLTSATDKTGTALASSTYAFIIDENSSSEEMVLADCTGTACVRITRGINPITGTSTTASLQKAHRRGASVKITDGPQLMILSRIINGNGTVPNTLHYASTLSGISADTTAIPDVNYVNSVAIAGASNGSETTKGIIQLATALQAASSTSLGSTGAALVQASIYATDTPQRGCAVGYTATAGAGCSVIASLSGKIKQVWIDLTEAFTFTGAITIPASDTTTHAITLNSVAYKWPVSQNAASSTVLSTNGSGTLSWVAQPISQKALVTGSTLVTSGTSSTTLATYLIPANTLNGSSNWLKVQGYISSGSGSNCYWETRFGNGSATTSMISIGVGGNPFLVMSTIDSTIVATTTSAESAFSFAYSNDTTNLSAIGSNASRIAAYSATYSLTGPTYVDFVGRALSGACTLIGYSVQVVSQ